MPLAAQIQNSYVTSWGKVLRPDANNNLANYVDDAAASAGGVPVGGIYRTGNDVKVRVN